MERKEAIQIIKNNWPSDRHMLSEALEFLLPELKESEDERIKNEIIAFVEQSIHRGGGTPIPQEQENKWIAWLEKQGEQKFADGTFVNVDDVREDFVQEVYRVLDADSTNDRANQIIYAFDNLPTVIIEKQGEQKPMPQEYADAFDEFMSHIPEKEPEFSESCYNYDDMVSAVQFGIKWQQQHDSIVKVNPKYEPKFKVGDWVIGIVTENEPRQIAEVTEEGYKSTYGGWYGFSFEEDMRLWSIRDAKCGDVLVCKGNIKNSNGIKYERICLFNNLDKAFFTLTKASNYVEDYDIDVNIDYPDNTVPATKEQKEILLMAMTDSGYTFDFEKKELKEIEQKPAWSEEDENLFKCAIDAVKQESKVRIDGCLDEEVGEMVTNWLKSLKDRIQPKQEWSEEDINMIDWLIRCCEKEHEELCNDKYGHQDIVSDLKRDCRKKWDWLESLKNRVAPQKHWKPTEEQIAAIEYIIRSYESTTIHLYDGVAKQLYKLLEQLKNL